MFASEVLFNTHKSLLLYSNVENLHTLHHYFPVKLFVVVEMFYIWVIQKGMWLYQLYVTTEHLKYG